MANKMRLFVTVEDVYKALEEGVKITDKFGYTHPTKTGGKSIRLSLGRIWFNLLQPSDFPLYDEPIDKSKTAEIFKKVIDTYPPEYAADYLTKVNQETFKMGSYIPTTFSSEAVIPSEDFKEAKEELQKADITNPVDYINKNKELGKIYAADLAKTDERVDDIRISGAKGLPWETLMGTIGFVGDIEGKVLGPIKTSVNDGLNPKDLYASAAEARNGFFYKAAASSAPGYLARRVTMANANIVLDDSKKDCGTKKFFTLQVDKDFAGVLTDRYVIGPSGKPKLIGDPQELIGETIKLRSPLYCKSEKGICPICYGESWKLLKTQNIGVLIGGVLNKVALNAYMKMRHSSSVPTFVEVNFDKDLVKYHIIDKDFMKAFKVEPHSITANTECFIELDLNEYHEDLVIESAEYWLVPGILTATLTEDYTKSWTFPFNYPVKLHKSSEIQEKGKLITINYQPGDTMITQDYYTKSSDVSVMEQLIEGQAKYIKSPEMLVFALRNYFGGIDLCLIETLVQNMFRDAEDPQIPARLTGYTNFEIYGQKKLPFVTSWLNALSFENVRKAITYGLVSGQNATEDPITKIVNEKYQ